MENDVQPPSSQSADFSVTETKGNMAPPPKPTNGQNKTSYLAGRSSNRLSLSFPIQLPDRERVLSSRQAPTLALPAQSSLKQGTILGSPKDSSGFMVALAAQERRVLELKEELNRAESELKKLKRQWAVHEGSKKRTDSRHGEPLRLISVASPVSHLSPTEESDESSSSKKDTEIGRRKALLTKVSKESRRKVITGGHTRALSLLSPARSSYDSLTSPASVFNADNEGFDAEKHPQSTFAIPEVKPDSATPSNKMRHSYHDSATNGVKQIAEDIKAGIWTFMEDLRQATVGDEALRSPTSHAQQDTTLVKFPPSRSSKGSPAGSNRHQPRPSENTRDHLATESRPEAPKPPASVQRPPKPLVIASGTAEVDDDDWANWDSPISRAPSPRWSNSTSQSSQSAVTGNSSTGSPSSSGQTVQKSTATRSRAKAEDLTWPVLNNLTPGNLKRTASALMKEWEKGLSPPSEGQGNTRLSSRKESQPTNDQETRLLLSNLP